MKTLKKFLKTLNEFTKHGALREYGKTVERAMAAK